MNKLVSVIIPVYNTEKYLSECVESVACQTYTNLEIILVDDGSTDSCPALCDGLSGKDGRITVIHKENGGLSSARNAGIAAARGEYVSFIDSDDVISPFFAERLLTAAEKYGADFAACLFKRFEDTVPEISEGEREPELLSRSEAFGCFFSGRNVDMVIAPNKLYRRSLFDGIKYPEGRLHEDEAVIHHLIGAAEKIAWLDEPHYFYRVTPSSITTKSFSLARLDEAKAKEDRIAYFESIGEHVYADKTRKVYLNVLMTLYRRVYFNIEDKELKRENCRALHRRFCEIYKECGTGESVTARIRHAAFRFLPKTVSLIDDKRFSEGE